MANRTQFLNFHLRRLIFITLFVYITQTEIDYLGIAIVVQQNILWLQVAVYDSDTVQILDSFDYLTEYFAGLILCEPK